MDVVAAEYWVGVETVPHETDVTGERDAPIKKARHMSEPVLALPVSHSRAS